MEKEFMAISGPISIELAEYDGRKYIFLEDKHFGRERTCENCETVNNCIDLTKLVENIFTNNENNKNGSQLFLEVRFQKGKNMVAKMETGGFIIKLYDDYHDCFNKKQTCGFRNTLFHFSDIRGVHLDTSAEEFIKGLKNINTSLDFPEGYGLTEHVFLGPSNFIVKKIRESIESFRIGERYNDTDIKNTVYKLYLNNTVENSLYYKIYETYLMSDNVIHDITGLIKNLNIPENIFLEKSMIVRRGNKLVHRIRSQLLALEDEGNSQLAAKIIQYILFKYANILNQNRIILQKLVNLPQINEKGILSIQNQFSLATNSLIFHRLDAIMMDAYTLSRMFRNFNTIDNYKIKTSIIYAGGFHTKNYTEFFTHWLRTRVIKYPSKSDDKGNPIRCVNISQQDYFWMIN